MALTFLSGDMDEVGGKKKKSSAKKTAKKEKKAAKKSAKKEKKAVKKAAKKAAKASKPKVKKVAKIGLAPSRNAFLGAVNLNLLKVATKLARVWVSPGGKEKLTKFWIGAGGDPAKLKKAISKGSKQTLSGAEMGAVAATTAALAAPLLVAVAKIISAFKAGGDNKEKGEFDKGVNQALNDLSEHPDADVSDQSMPEGSDVAVVKPKGGSGGGGGTDSNDSGGEGDEDGSGTTNGSLATNPGTISLIIPMLISMMDLQNPVLVFLFGLISIYCMIGILVIPFSEFGIAGERVKKISRKYFDIPAFYFYRSFNYIAQRISHFYHGKI